MIHPKVSVCLVTYQQQTTIAQAIEGVLAQRTSFSVELVIGEDCSTDGTRDIVSEAARTAPERVRALLQPTNRGLLRNFVDTFSACRGEYVALLDGDDYWTDSGKLELQANFLDRHPDCSMCFHNAAVILPGGEFWEWKYNDPSQKLFLTIDDLLEINPIATSSAMIRRSALPDFPSWYVTLPWEDWPLFMLLAERGPIGYLPDTMAVYRNSGVGAWTGMPPVRQLEAKIEFLLQIDERLDRRYSKRLRESVAKYRAELDSLWLTTGAPAVSVVVCTRNRARWLSDTLVSLEQQDRDSPAFEVLVVDNGSTDDTPAVVAAFAERSQFRYVLEPALGLCHARNRGLHDARGVYVAFLDDDAIASSSWIKAIVQAFAACPEAGAVGGRVDPIWTAAQPAWLSDHVARALTIVDWSATPMVLPELRDAWLVGANMAVRADVGRRIGGFRPQLDRAGTKMLSSGDVYFLKEMSRAGWQCFYYPDMAIRHLVPASRLTKRWFRNRYLWQGVSDAVMELLDRRPTRQERWSLIRRSFTELATDPKRLATLLPTDDPAKFAETCWTLIAIGHFIGLLRMRTFPTPSDTRVS